MCPVCLLWIIPASLGFFVVLWRTKSIVKAFKLTAANIRRLLHGLTAV